MRTVQRWFCPRHDTVDPMFCLFSLTPSADPGIGLSGDNYRKGSGLRFPHRDVDIRVAWNGIGTGIVGTIGYVVLPTGVSTDVSRDIV